jgi:hypothetical protein
MELKRAERKISGRKPGREGQLMIESTNACVGITELRLKVIEYIQVKEDGRIKKGCKIEGNMKVESARDRPVTGCPRDGRSAKLSKDGTYREEVQSL